MPQVLRVGAYRFYFYSHEPHIHVDRERFSAKFWLQPTSLARNLGFNGRELRAIERIVEENRVLFLERWNGYFGIIG
jgi:hypothetical protein